MTSDSTGLMALFASSFLSATVLPGNSEAVLLVLLMTKSATMWAAIGVATLGNTLGGLTTYALGRVLPRRADARALAWLRRYGPPILVFSWLPVVGDVLCAGAGWLRLNPWLSTLFMATGKFARYWMLAQWVV